MAKTLPLIIILVAVLSFLTIDILCIPPELDESVYLSNCIKLMREGGVLYKDAWDHKPPLLYAWYWLSIKLLGPNLQSARVIGAGTWLLSIYMVYLLGKRVYQPKVGVAAAVLFAISYCRPLLQFSGTNAEVFMLPLLLIGTYFAWLCIEHPSIGCLFLSGLAFSFSIWTKQTAIFHFLLCGLLLCFHQGRGVNTPTHSVKYTVYNIFFYFIGFIIISCIIFYYLSYVDAMNAFIESNIVFNVGYTHGWNPAWYSLFHAGVLLLAESPILYLLLFIGLFLIIKCFKSNMIGNIFLIVSLSASIIGWASTGRFFRHYFSQMYPFMAILGGYAAVELGHLIVGWKRTAALMIVGSLLICSLIADFVYVSYLGRKYQVYRDIAQAIKDQTATDDRLFTYGMDTQLHIWANRVRASKYPWFRVENGSEIMQEMSETPPAAIVLPGTAVTRDDQFFGYLEAYGYRALGPYKMTAFGYDLSSVIFGKTQDTELWLYVR